jgi:hypothetical protein
MVWPGLPGRGGTIVGATYLGLYQAADLSMGDEAASALINANLGMAILVCIVHAVAMIAAGGFLAWLVVPTCRSMGGNRPGPAHSPERVAGDRTQTRKVSLGAFADRMTNLTIATPLRRSPRPRNRPRRAALRGATTGLDSPKHAPAVPWPVGIPSGHWGMPTGYS